MEQRYLLNYSKMIKGSERGITTTSHYVSLFQTMTKVHLMIKSGAKGSFDLMEQGYLLNSSKRTKESK